MKILTFKVYLLSMIFLALSCGKEDFLENSSTEDLTEDAFALEEFSATDSAEKKQKLYEAILAELSLEQAKTNFALAYDKLKFFAERHRELCPPSEEVKALMTEAKALPKEEQKAYFEENKLIFETLKDQKINCMVDNKLEFADLYYTKQLMKMACGIEDGKKPNEQKIRYKKDKKDFDKKDYKKSFKLLDVDKLDPWEAEKIKKIAAYLDEKLVTSTCEKVLLF